MCFMHRSRQDRGGALRARLATPVMPALVLLALAALVVTVRLEFAARGNLARFIVVGTRLVDVERLPSPRVPVNPRGYDGQFYYRLAVDPADLSTTAHGIRLDSSLRRQRIGYPVLAWALARGQAAAIPAALVGVNVLGLALAGLFGGLLAHELGRHPLWGLLPAGYSGLVTTLARDLTEITALMFMLAGLVAVHRQRHIWAAFALASATLCRETALVVPAALALTRLIALVRRQARPGTADLAWTVPLLVWAGWQVLCAVRYGQLPVLSGRGITGVPLAAVTTATVRWVTHPAARSALQLLQLATLVFVVVAALRRLVTSRALPVERVAFAFAVLLMLSLSGDVWGDDPAAFRIMVDAWALGTIILLGSPGAPLAIPAALNAILWMANALLRAIAL
jgi:hypothetical protein